MVTFKVNPKVLSSTTKKWVSSGTSSKGTSFKVTAAPKSTALSSGVSKSSFSTSDRLLQQKISISSLNAAPIPTRTITFKTVTPPIKVSKPGIWSATNWGKPTPTSTGTIVFKTKAPVTKTPVKGIFSPTNWGKPTPYVAPKPKQGTWVAAKKSSGSGSSGGGGPPIGTFHPDSANIAAQKNSLLRSKNIGTGGKVTY